MPISEWPAMDRKAWETGISNEDIFDGNTIAYHWNQRTCELVAQHYGRWLTFLAVFETLDPRAELVARLDQETLARYINHLNAFCASSTVSARINGLVDAVRIIAPNADISWLKAIAKNVKRQAKSLPKAANLLPSIAEIYKSGLRIMQEVSTRGGRGLLRDALEFRNGLMVSLLAARPVRLRDFANIQIGHHLCPAGDGYSCVNQRVLTTKRSARSAFCPL